MQHRELVHERCRPMRVGRALVRVRRQHASRHLVYRWHVQRKRDVFGELQRDTVGHRAERLCEHSISIIVPRRPLRRRDTDLLQRDIEWQLHGDFLHARMYRHSVG